VTGRRPAGDRRFLTPASVVHTFGMQLPIGVAHLGCRLCVLSVRNFRGAARASDGRHRSVGLHERRVVQAHQPALRRGRAALLLTLGRQLEASTQGARMPPAVIMPSRLQPLDCPSGRRHYVCHMLAYDSISGMQLSRGSFRRRELEVGHIRVDNLPKHRLPTEPERPQTFPWTSRVWADVAAVPHHGLRHACDPPAVGVGNCWRCDEFQYV
jgi:hypothetical protein